MNQLNVDCSACILWLEIISLLQTFGQNYQLFHLDSANYKVYEKDPSCISLGKIWTWPLCSWYKWLEWMESVRLRCNSNTTRGSWSFLALTFQVCVCLRMDTHTHTTSEPRGSNYSKFTAQMANHFIRMPIRCREGKRNLCVAERGGLVLMRFLQTALHSQN